MDGRPDTREAGVTECIAVLRVEAMRQYENARLWRRSRHVEQADLAWREARALERAIELLQRTLNP